MNIKLFTAAALSSLMMIAAAPAMAQTAETPANAFTGYGTLGYTQFDQSAGSNFGALTGRLGLRYGHYLGAEAEGTFGITNDTYLTGRGAKADIDLDHSVAAYAVGYLPVSPRFDLLARIGYGDVETHTTTIANDSRIQRSSVNYGAGAQYFLTAKDGVRGDYTREDYTGGPGHADVWAVSYVRKF